MNKLGPKWLILCSAVRMLGRHASQPGGMPRYRSLRAQSMHTAQPGKSTRQTVPPWVPGFNFACQCMVREGHQTHGVPRQATDSRRTWGRRA